MKLRRRFIITKHKTRQDKTRQDKTRQDKTNSFLLCVSSLVFITNVITTWQNNMRVYALLFTLLTISSIIVHTHNNYYTNIADKFNIFMVFLYGLYILYHKTIDSFIFYETRFVIFVLIWASFLATIYLYGYGFIIKQYCFYPKRHVSEAYHVLLHIVGSIGHHLIVYL